MWPPNRSKFFSDVEALRLLISRETEESEAPVLALCGLGSRPGVTTLTAWLGFSLADQGKPTTIIDGNGSSPRLHLAFKCPQRPGAADLLEKRATWMDALRPTSIEALKLLPAGEMVNQKGRLSTESWRELLQGRRSESRYVLVDAGKFGSAASLAVTLASDLVLLVVEAGKCRRETVSKSVELLRKHRARILGVVLNKRRYRIPEFIYRRL